MFCVLMSAKEAYRFRRLRNVTTSQSMGGGRALHEEKPGQPTSSFDITVEFVFSFLSMLMTLQNVR
jgi:hypothetical protein